MSGAPPWFYFGLFGAVAILWLLAFARRFPPLVTVTFLLAGALDAFGWAFQWLDTVPLYDEGTHLAVTFALTVPATLALHRCAGSSGVSTRSTFAFATLGLGVLASVAWESVEWSYDHFLEVPGTMDLSDTMRDLLSGVAGAFLAIPTAWALMRRERARPAPKPARRA
jgi:hypothetical protein